MRRLLAAIALVGVALASGCAAVRLESEDPVPASAGPQEQQRQGLAEETQRLASAAERAIPSADAATAEVLAAVVTDSATHLDVLGPVWRPGGRHASEIVPRGDAADVLAMLTTSAQTLRETAVTTEGDLLPLLTGIALSRQLRADQLAVALGGEPGAVEPALPSTLDASSAADLIRTHDALGQAWEIVAARADDEKQQAAAAEARHWRTAAQRLAALAGVADTADDPRLISYDVAADPGAAISDLEAALLPGWLAQVPTTSGEDRARSIDLALTAAREIGLGTPGADVPAILGMVTD